jgi:hypothetical protein
MHGREGKNQSNIVYNTPNKTSKKNYSDSEDESSYSGSYDNDDYSSYSSEEEKPTKSYKSNNNGLSSNTQLKGNQPTQDQMSIMKAEFDRLLQPADIKLYTVTYTGTRRLLPKQFLDAVEGGKPGEFKLRNDGKFILSYNQKHLTREFGNNQPDFDNIRQDQAGGKHDLIGKTSLKIRCNWPGKTTFGLPTINTTSNIFYEKTTTGKEMKEYVSCPVSAGVFKPEGSFFESVVLDNTTLLTNSVKDYANQFAGYNPDNMKHHTYETMDHVILPLGHPAVMVYNTKPENKTRQLSKPSPGFEKTNQVIMELSEGRECIELATKRVSGRTPYGNVTDRFRIEVSANMDYERSKAVEKGKSPYLGFADFDIWFAAQPNLYAKKLHPDSGLPMREHFENTYILMDVTATIEYTRLNGKTI